MRRRSVLAFLLSLPSAAFAAWTQIPVGSGAANTWRKTCAATGGANTWRKLGSCAVGGGLALTISANTANYNLKSAAIAAGWDGVSALTATVTINAGVCVYSASTGAYAFDTGSGFPGGSALTLVNNGTILGRGGNGGAGAWCNAYGSGLANATAGTAAGPAFIARTPISVQNNGTIAGGGGGGGGGGANMM